MEDKGKISLFPLKVVMFPGGKQDLQIFERRYIDLIRSCLRDNTGFGICLLKEGEEVVQESTKQTIHRIGTFVNIVDWDQLDNGLLGITVEGSAKFKIEDCWQADSGVLQAEVEFSTSDRVGTQAIPLDDKYAPLTELLQSLENHPMVEQRHIAIDYDNLWDLGWRLSELIPVDTTQQQELLETGDPHERISIIERLVADMANNA